MMFSFTITVPIRRFGPPWRFNFRLSVLYKMDKVTNEFMFNRIYPLIQMGRAIDKDVGESCMFIDALERKEEDSRSTSKTHIFQSTVRWKGESGRERTNKVFCKAMYVDPLTVSIPTTFLNELHLMRTVVRDMVKYGRSPHFIFPISQIYGKEKIPSLLDLKEFLRKTPEAGCPTKTGDLGIYNVMEYFDPEFTFTTDDLFYFENISDEALVLYLKQILFQVLYNLSIMENLKFRHGDLHLKNVLLRVSPDEQRPVIYSPDPQTFYRVDNQIFSFFIDFDRSTLHTPPRQTSSLTDEELGLFPCVSVDRLDTVPHGLREGCQFWNPYADWTRFVAHLMISLEKARGSKFADWLIRRIFPSEDLYSSVTAVLGDVRRYKFGRPSFLELKETVSEEVLAKTTPGVLLREYVRQFSQEPWIGVFKEHETGTPIFRAYA